jgi:hypothetical protein
VPPLTFLIGTLRGVLFNCLIAFRIPIILELVLTHECQIMSFRFCEFDLYFNHPLPTAKGAYHWVNQTYIAFRIICIARFLRFELSGGSAV